MVSVRFASVIFLAAFMAASTVQSATMNNKPYSPDLYAREALLAESPSSFGMVRRVEAAKPYAPDLFSRQSLEESETEDESEIEVKRSTVVKRSISPAATATWSLFKRTVEESEEDLHARGLVDDAQIEARGHCNNDSQCNADQYCSSKRHKCYRKIHDYNHCSRNEACGSGYCCESDNLCKPKREDGEKCHGNDSACGSSYCSVVSDKCRPQAPKGDGCRVDQGCKGSLSCVNGRCKHSGSSHPSKPHHPNHPAPSGSARQRRTLTSL